MAPWLIVLEIVAVVLGIVVVAGVSERQMDKKVASTIDWLETEATIQSTNVEKVDRYTFYPSFVFSYSVLHEYFSGKCFLKVDADQADQLRQTLLGQKFALQYDPKDPSAWYIEGAM